MRKTQLQMTAVLNENEQVLSGWKHWQCTKHAKACMCNKGNNQCEFALRA